MLTDGRSIPPNTVLVVDLCIIGSGPAGLAIANELRRCEVRSAYIAFDSTRSRKGLARVPKHLALAARHALPVARYLTSRYLGRRNRPKCQEWTGVVRGSFELSRFAYTGARGTDEIVSYRLVYGAHQSEY